MMTDDEKALASQRAYIPEHLCEYVKAVSRLEPFLLGEYLFYLGRGRMVFVGYALDRVDDQDRLTHSVQYAIERFLPQEVALIAPVIPAAFIQEACSEPDQYSQIDLQAAPGLPINPSKKIRNQVRRAAKDLQVEVERGIHRDHRLLVEAFLRNHDLEAGNREIFKRLPDYVKNPSAWVISARNSKGKLAGFDIVDFGARDFAFYMFNFRSTRFYTPGVSDILFWQFAAQAQAAGKNHINMGLGINPGVTFFKHKWGAQAVLPYQTCRFYPAGKPDVGDIYGELMGKLF
jgi:hypothetical protein